MAVPQFKSSHSSADLSRKTASQLPTSTEYRAVSCSLHSRVGIGYWNGVRLHDPLRHGRPRRLYGEDLGAPLDKARKAQQSTRADKGGIPHSGASSSHRVVAIFCVWHVRRPQFNRPARSCSSGVQLSALLGSGITTVSAVVVSGEIGI